MVKECEMCKTKIQLSNEINEKLVYKTFRETHNHFRGSQTKRGREKSERNKEKSQKRQERKQKRIKKERGEKQTKRTLNSNWPLSSFILAIINLLIWLQTQLPNFLSFALSFI